MSKGKGHDNGSRSDLPPKRRGQLPTLADSEATEDLRRKSETEIEAPKEPYRRISSGALNLANSFEAPDEPGGIPTALPPSDDAALADLGIELSPYESEPDDGVERPTHPAPPDYEVAATKAVDGAIPLAAQLSPPKMPLDALVDESERRTQDRRRTMRELEALGDFTGALDAAEAVLTDSPADDDARALRDRCRETLMKMYTARVGSFDRVPVVIVPAEQLRWMSIDQKAAFVLHHVDGMSSLEMILDVSGMPHLDVLRILSDLVQQRVISFR
ncbi:MAG: hypothetical protein U0174_24015 [Polyangiaceae bacterium]